MGKYFLIASLLILSLYSQAQEENESDISQLLILNGKVETYYSEGCEAKARYLQEFLLDAIIFYQDKLRDTIDIKLFVLNKHDWKSFSGGPYLIPSFEKDPDRIIMGIYELFKIELPENETLYGSSELFFWDFIIVHELGHYISKQHGLKSLRWTSEFFANYLMIAFMLERVPYIKQSSLTSTIFKFAPFKYKTLKDFEGNISRIDPLNYSMYQAKFQELASRIYKKSGWDFMYEYIDRSSREINPPPDKNYLLELTIAEFQKMEPEIFDDWSEEMRQTFHPLIILLLLISIIVSIRLLDTSCLIIAKTGIKTKRRYWILGVPSLVILSQINHVEYQKNILRLKLIVGLRPIMYLSILLLVIFLLIHH